MRAFYGTDNSLCTCGNGDACRSLARMSTWVELISRSALRQSQHLVQRTHIYDIVCAFIIIGSQHHNAMLHTTTCTEITTGSFLEHELAFLSLSLRTQTQVCPTSHARTHMHAINQYILNYTSLPTCIRAGGDQPLRGVQYTGCRLCVSSQPEAAKVHISACRGEAIILYRTC